MWFFFTPILIRLIHLSSKNNKVASAFSIATSRNAKSNPPLYSARNGVSPADVWPIYTIPIYSNLVEAVVVTAGREAVDYPAEIRPQRMPELPHATTKQTLNRGQRGSRGNRTIRSFFRFPRSRTERRGNISFFLLCDVHREYSTSFFLFYRSLTDMLPRGVTDRFVPKSGTILADFSHLLVTLQ